VVCDRLVTGLSQPFNQKVRFLHVRTLPSDLIARSTVGVRRPSHLTICIWSGRMLHAAMTL
jgi:hypothetical protein